MKITITRRINGDWNSNGDQGRFSDLTCDLSPFTCLAGEDPWRDDSLDRSSVPVGTYKAIRVFSQRFQRDVFQLQSVPGPTPGSWRFACELHAGNYCGDVNKGFRSDVEGCTILGAPLGELPNGHGINQLCVLDSLATLS